RVVEAAPPLVGSDFQIPLLGPAAQWLPAILAGLLLLSVVLQPKGIGGVWRDLGEVLGGRRDRPSPRPQATDAVASAHRATALRNVPRPLSHRLPTRALLVAESVTVRYGGVLALD